MDKYLFITRDSDTGDPKVIAKVIYKPDSVRWEGPSSASIRKWLLKTNFEVLNRKPFDENSKEHWKKLPQIIKGSYMWVNHEVNSSLKELFSLIR